MFNHHQSINTFNNDNFHIRIAMSYIITNYHYVLVHKQANMQSCNYNFNKNSQTPTSWKFKILSTCMSFHNLLLTQCSKFKTCT